jgi:hypothetical protein
MVAFLLAPRRRLHWAWTGQPSADSRHDKGQRDACVHDEEESHESCRNEILHLGTASFSLAILDARPAEWSQKTLKKLSGHERI